MSDNKHAISEEEKENSPGKRITVPFVAHVPDSTSVTPLWDDFEKARRAHLLAVSPHTIKRDDLDITLGSEADVRLIMNWVYDHQSRERFPMQEDIGTVRLLRADLRAFIGKPTPIRVIMEAISDFDTWDEKDDGVATFIGKLMLL